MMEGHSFWPIAQCLKEGRSLKKDSVNDSNITKGVLSLPPVESQDTAYQPKSKVTDRYAMRAPGSVRNNIKEGGIILEVPMDDKDGKFSKECRNWDNRIESYVAEQIPPYPPVAKPSY
jgi:hypothetical protein